MGMSLDEQARTPLYEISQLLAVDDVYNEHQRSEQEKAQKKSKSPGRGKLGGGM